ncbi:MAG: virulence factor SrfB [Pirellulaceae bacterium]
MQASTNSSVLFANTGVQILCFPLKPGLRFSADQLGYGWQRCRCQAPSGMKDYWYIQWQLIPGQNQLLLAIDTTIGPNEKETDTGYFCKDGRMLGDFEVSLEGLLGTNGQPLPGVGKFDFLIRSATAEGGDPKDVHLVVDFGNNRTGGLLIEFHGDVAQDPLMQPLQLMHRYHLDAWDEKGELARNHATWWFSSRSHWCSSPYLDPPKIEDEIYVKDTVKGLLGTKQIDKKTTVFSTPETFQDLSQIRMGREAHDLSLVMRTDGEVRTSLSSPKRYLWGKDASWLDGANWYMADPNGRYDNDRHAATLRGPLLRYLSEDDRIDEPNADYDEFPSKPTHAPRVLMMGAMYEILAQAYVYINSPTYRRTAGEPHRMRRLRSVTLTYPSGMILTERQELQRQAQKAVYLFHTTTGKMQDLPPEFNLSIDEASAVHLTYMWSEIQKLGKKPSLWFQLMGRSETPTEVQAENDAADGGDEAEEAAPVKRPAGRRRSKVGGRRGGRGAATAQAGRGKPTLPEVRIACIDIGGGTSDLMIAKYTCEAHSGGDRVVGETLHRDGIYLAGDHLVKRLLECIIVPQFADANGLEDHDVLRLFGPEVPGSNREFRAQRINWINRLFVPLAQQYLEFAVDVVEDEEISHTNPDLVAPEVVESLQATIDQHWGTGHYQVNQPLQLYFDQEDFEDIVDEVFGDLILDFCESIVEHQADVVLLAGLPTKLRAIQELVQQYLPLPNSRIIPMFNRYVGTWYPYQNPDHMNPGVIVDPKSTVVVGAAVEFSARFGMLSQFKFRMKDEAAKQSYFWGVMTESRIDEQKILFDSIPQDEQRPSRESHVLSVSDRRLVIGRKRRASDDAQATPVYVIKVHVGQRLGEIDVDVTLTRTLGPEGEEQLEVTEVTGDVAGEPAELGGNVTFEWRTLADERYYLDTGGLDKIELGV